MTSAERKASLLAHGRILVPRGLWLPVLLSRSSAGPGGGQTSLFFRIGGSLLRLEVVREGPAPLRLRRTPAGFDILRGRRVLARDVSPQNAGFHAPGQAFINLHGSCRYHCAFCSLPGAPAKGPSLSRWQELILGALRDGKVDAVALTTGIPQTPSRACRDLSRLAAGIRRDFPAVPIGVEPYTVSESDLRRLRDAGAGELKLNIQCATSGLLERVCPGLDWAGILKNLEAGVRLFGKGNVCSNLIIGLGETDAEALAAVEKLAVMGVAVNLRPLRLNPHNRERLRRALGKLPGPVRPARLVRLAAAQKRLFALHGLDPGRFRTMCHRCTACDLAPFRDI